jgi:nicotinamidase-related amidase
MHIIDLPQWAVERGRHTNWIRTIDLARTALICIDLQNAFMLAGQVFGNPHALDIVPNVNRLAGAFRAAGGRVVWTRQTVSDDPLWADPHWAAAGDDPFVATAKAALRVGSHGHALHAAIDRAPGDLMLDKHRYSAFLPNSSDLDAQLKAAGIDVVIIAGTLTNCCCESSARDAFMQGYKVLLVSDATAAVTDAEHNAALLNLRLMFADVKSTAETLALIEAARG